MSVCVGGVLCVEGGEYSVSNPILTFSLITSYTMYMYVQCMLYVDKDIDLSLPIDQ